MTDKTQATRLGDILLEKGLVNSAQLRKAIVEQQQRRRTIDTSDSEAMDASSLGKILIEFGFITEQQLKRGLSWQMSLRRMTIAMALCAPLMSFGVGAAAASSGSTASSTKASAAQSLTIQAEDYTSMYGIQTEFTTDIGGGMNVGWMHADDWLAYGNAEILVPASGTYKVTYRLASPSGGGIFALREADGSIEFDRINVPQTGSSQTWVDVERTVTLSAGTHRFGINVLERGSGFNLNWFRIEAVAVPTPASSQTASSAAAVVTAPALTPSSVPGSSVAASSKAASSAPASSTPTASSKAPASVSSAASAPKAATLPVTIQAEDFTSMFGIQAEPTADIGGGENIGYIHPNDWLSYSGKPIHAPVAGNYSMTFRVASPGGGGSFALHSADGSVQYGVIQVPATGGSQKWVNIETTISLPVGDHSFGITAITRGTSFNINWFNVEFKGVALPAKVEAESYSAMYGIQTETTGDVGGGLNVGYIDPGDSMSYADTVFDIPATGSYKITYRVASPSGGGSFGLHEVDGSAQYDLIAVPATGGSQKWVNLERVISLTKGSHSLGITAVSRGSGFNINWFKLEAVGQGGASSFAASSATTAATTSSVANSSAASSVPPVSVSSSSQSSASSAPAGTDTSGTAQVTGPVSFKWVIPNQRENGTYLDVTELGGYELRYKRVTDTSYIYVSINDAWQNYYNFSWLEGEYVFQIAAFDKNGIYSNFVDMAPQ